MKEIRNNTTRHLEMGEHRAILDLVEALERGFRKKVHTVTVNGDKERPDDVFGIMIMFDKFELNVKR